MDSLLLLGLGVVFVVALFVWLRGNSGPASSAASDEALAQSQKWRGQGAKNVDPQLRNRHGIQNGEDKVGIHTAANNTQWTIAEVAKHNKVDDLLIIVQNKVYDITDYVEDHPGGAATIVRYPGQDCTEQFSGIQHPIKVWDVVQDFYVGEIVESERQVYTFKTVSKL